MGGSEEIVVEEEKGEEGDNNSPITNSPILKFGTQGINDCQKAEEAKPTKEQGKAIVVGLQEAEVGSEGGVSGNTGIGAGAKKGEVLDNLE